MHNTNLFTNVFKSLFGSSITPTASQFVPITAQDGTPAGVSSMANLASVLGGLKHFILNTSSDFDTLVEQGTYWINDTDNEHAPTTGRYHLIVYVTSGDVLTQMAIDATAGSILGVYMRQKWGEWSSWSRIDNFGCNTLAELKAALANV